MQPTDPLSGETPAMTDEPTDPSPSATGLCGNAEDYEEYTSALRAAFGEDMGDGAETSLTCEIERLSRLAKQAVAMRQHFGKAVWCLDGEGISEFLKAATGAPGDAPAPRIEIPVCAAIRYHQTHMGEAAGEIIIAGRRHSDCLRSAALAGLRLADCTEQGFMTSRGRWVDRKYAFILMHKAELPSASPDGYRGRELFSEDLY